jgi:intron-binding protein aquarius
LLLQITTVDKYQGQQNDYVLLSLVRTRVVGHLRDVRRLVVALSRARLGLYVFGRQELFANCFELAPAFSRLLERPTQVSLGVLLVESIALPTCVAKMAVCVA